MSLLQIAYGSVRHVPDSSYFPAERRLGVLRDATAQMFYFTTIAAVLAFVWILTFGAHS